MSINDLLEELAACNSEITLNNLKTLADYELEGQDNITKEVVMKLLYYKQHVICNDKKAFAKLIGTRHWDSRIDDNTLSFTQNANTFFDSIDILFVIDILNGKVPYGKQAHDKLDSAKEAFSRFSLAYQQFTCDNRNLTGKKSASIGCLQERGEL